MTHPSRKRDFNRDRHNARLETAVESTEEIDGVAVRVDKGDPVPGFQIDIFAERPVEQSVCYFVRSRKQLPVS